MGTFIAQAEFDVAATVIYVGFAELDTRAEVVEPVKQVVISGIEFDANPGQVIVSGIEFDAGDPLDLDLGDTYGGRGRRTMFSTAVAKTAPPPAPTRYHGRSDEQLRLREAALLDDEEIVLSFLMEFACV